MVDALGPEAVVGHGQAEVARAAGVGRARLAARRPDVAARPRRHSGGVAAVPEAGRADVAADGSDAPLEKTRMAGARRERGGEVEREKKGEKKKKKKEREGRQKRIKGEKWRVRER